MNKILFSLFLVSCVLQLSAQTLEEITSPVGYTTGISKSNDEAPIYSFTAGNTVGSVGLGTVRTHTGWDDSYFTMPSEPPATPDAVEIVKVFVRCNMSALSGGSLQVYAGTSRYYTDAMAAWNSPSSMTLIATKSTTGPSETEVTGSAFTTMADWLDDRDVNQKKIYFTLKESDETKYATIFEFAIHVQYRYKYTLHVSLERSYNNSVGTVTGTLSNGGSPQQINQQEMDFTFYKDETISFNLNRSATSGQQQYSYSNSLLNGSGFSQTTKSEAQYSFNMTSYTTAVVRYVLGINVTLDNQVQFLSGATARITSSTLRASQGGQEIATVSAGNSVIVPQDVNIDYKTLYGNNGEDLAYQGTYKIKHRDWNVLLTHAKLTLTSPANQPVTNTAWYHELKPASIAATFEGSAQNSVALQFKDPWRVVGGTQPANWDDYTAPASLGIANDGVNYPGAFQNVSYLPDQPSAAVYRVKADNAKTLNNVMSFFVNWSGSGIEAYSPTSSESPIKFTSANATVTANYKGSRISTIITAFANSSQRKFIRTSAKTGLPNGTLHVVYESMGYVWYESSTDNGTTWQLMNGNQPISGSGGKLPSLSWIDNGYGAQAVFITYQEGASVKLKSFAATHLGTTFNYLGQIGPTYSYITDNANPVVVAVNLQGGAHKILLVWEAKSTQFGWTPGLRYLYGQITENNLDFASLGSITEGRITGTAASSASPSLAGTSYYNFQLVWQEGTSTIYYEPILDAGTNITQQQRTDISTGGGYTLNYQPSIISIGDGARVIWIGSRYVEGGGEGLARTSAGGGYWEYRSVFKDPGYYMYWALGNDVGSVNINKKDAENGYVIAWSESNGAYNKYTKNGPGSLIETFSSIGKDIQVNNGSGYDVMRATALNLQTSPYSLTLSGPSGSLPKEGVIPALYAGREGIVFKGKAQFYFALGDITVDNKDIQLEDIPDTLEIKDIQTLNANLVSKPFALNDNSLFTYGVQYGITDSSAAVSLLGENGKISFKVELVDETTGELLSTFDQVEYTGSNVFQYNNIGYRVNTEGIGQRTVRLKVVVQDNLGPLYSLSNKFADTEGGVLGKRKALKTREVKPATMVREYDLSQNYPNPFNPTTVIYYQIPDPGRVVLKIHDILGKEVATLVDGYKRAGGYEVTFDASNLSSGAYFYTMRAGKFTETRKLQVLK